MLNTTRNAIILTTHRHVRRCAALAALAGLATFGAATAQAKTQHRYTSVIENVAVASGGGYPAPGGTAVLAGTWASSLYGDGAVVDHVTITGHPTPTTFTFRGTEVGFVARGTFSDTFTGTATVQPNATEKVTIAGRITGGSGAYRGATGSFKFKGATAAGSTVVFGHSAGTVSY
jgi:hypothetical protein